MDLNHPRARRDGVYAHSTTAGRAILIVTLAGVLLFATGFWRALHNPDYTAYKPNLALLYLTLRFRNDQAAPVELAERFGRGELGATSVRVINWAMPQLTRELALPRSGPVVAGRLYLPMLIDTAGHADEQRFREYLLTFVRPRLSVSRLGASPPSGLMIMTSNPDGGAVPTVLEVREVRINGIRTPNLPPLPGGRLLTMPIREGQLLGLDLPTDRAEVVIRLRLTATNRVAEGWGMPGEPRVHVFDDLEVRDTLDFSSTPPR